MNSLTNKNLKELAGIETKHTDSRALGWTWRAYYTTNHTTGGSPYHGGKVKQGAISGYYGYFDDIKRTKTLSGAGYNKEDFSIYYAVDNLSEELPHLTEEQRAELKEAAKLFKSGESFAVRIINRKAEEGKGSFYFETIRKDDTSRGTYLGKYPMKNARRVPVAGVRGFKGIRGIE